MQNALLKELGKQTLVSCAIYAVLFLALYAAEQLFPALDGRLLLWTLNGGTNWAFIIGVPASVFGTAYVLTIKNPQNYTGFYLGIVMSILLGVQFFLQKQFDSTFLYICVFIPFQVKSILNWKKPQDTSAPFSPEFLKMKGMLLSLLVCLAITFADYLLATFVFQHNGLGDNIAIKLFNGLLISSSVLANFWLIYRKNDAWIYWLLYSVAGIVLFILINNIFSIVLFIFFLVINGTACIAWIKGTKPENLGWVKGK